MKPTPTPSTVKPSIIMIPLTEIDDAPSLSYIPTLETAAELLKRDPDDITSDDEYRPGEDWTRLLASVRQYGVMDPIKFLRVGDRKQCVDGRSRLAAAKQVFVETGKGGEIPAIEVTDIDPETLARETLSRRNVPGYVLAYLYCRQHQTALLQTKRGGDRSKLPGASLLTQEGAAKACGCRFETISACVAALRHFAGHPADRERDEPMILAGLMHPSRFIHAAAGRAATAGGPRRPTSFTSWAPKWKSMVSNLRGWDEWAEADRENAKALLTKEAAEWPEGFRAVITEILNPQ